MVLHINDHPFTTFCYTDTYCDPDTDLVWNIEWEKTLGGVIAEEDCPRLNQDQMVSGKTIFTRDFPKYI